MKKAFKFIVYCFSGCAILILLILLFGYIHYNSSSKDNIRLLGNPSPKISVDGNDFRDLNKNGKLDAYEDFRQPIENRIDDLLSQMNLAEKAGMMFVAMAGMGSEGNLHERPNPLDPFSLFPLQNSELIARRNINHMNLADASANDIRRWTKKIQSLADRTRLGIPVTVATDPRNAFGTNPLAGFQSEGFSKWPEPLGFAALRDSILLRKFAEIARKEYRAVVINLALHPMADLATEPRWSRISGTFGEDAELSSAMVYQYVKGFQGDSLTATSVACMTKHFSGGGPQLNGLDPHFDFGKDQVYPGNNFEYHILPLSPP